MDTNEPKRECTRCNRTLNRINTNPDGLCGLCQQELAPHHDNSPRYIDWVMRGRPREIQRSKSGTPYPIMKAALGEKTHILPPSPLFKVPTSDLIEELQRRYGEAEKTLAALRDFGTFHKG